MAQSYKMFRPILREIKRNERERKQKSSEDIMSKQETDNIKKFGDFLQEHPSVDGYMQNGELKAQFGRLGKKALNELAMYLGLPGYKVDFNKAGPAISGDLTLMGMFDKEKGIYFSISRDGNSRPILYRSIKNMKDYSGGMNNWMKVEEFANAEAVKEKVFNLLKVEIPERTEPEEKTESKTQTQEKNYDRIDGSLPAEEYLTEFNKRFDKALETDNLIDATGIVNELYQEIRNGRQMALTPLLIEKLQEKKVKTALTYFPERVINIHEGLIGHEDFRKHLNANLWDLIPAEYKKVKTIKPVSWEADPKNENLADLLKSFLSRDPLRPALLTANFEEEGMVATDAEKLIFLNKTYKGKKGLYCLTETCFKNYEGQENPVKSGYKYPDYKAVIPKSSAVIVRVEPEVLLRYCLTLKKAGFIPKPKFSAAFKYGDNSFIFFNAEKLASCMEAFLKLGYTEIEFGITSPNKGMLITPVGMNARAHQETTPFVLVMPLYHSAEDDKALSKGDFYFDLNNQAAVTVGIPEIVYLGNNTHTESSKENIMKATEAAIEDFQMRNDLDGNDINDLRYPWEMTQLDYQKIKSIQRSGMPQILNAADKKEHEALIKQAMEYGLEVPKEVLESYPWLKNGSQIASPAKSENALIGNNWFKQHPEKVLGEEYQTTNRFNKEVTRVKGNIDDVINGIDTPEVNAQLPSNPVRSVNADQQDEMESLLENESKRKNIERVIALTKKELGEKALRKINGEPDKYVHGCPEEYYCFDEIMQQYNAGISEDEIKAWVWYKRKTKGFNNEVVILKKTNGWSKYVVPFTEIQSYLPEWVKKGILCYYKGDLMPSVLYYAENINERLEELLIDKDAIISKYGAEQYERQRTGLNNIIPPQLDLSVPDLNNRLFIKPISAFARETQVFQFSDGSSSAGKSETNPSGSTSLLQAFEKWLDELPKNVFKKSNNREIIDYYLHEKNFPKSMAQEDKLRIKQNAKIEGDFFFVKFLAEGISREDQLRIEKIWNKKYNGYIDIDYFRVPVAFTCSSTFKNKPLSIRQAQREGIGFISVHGSGCVAYDVGLGKTMTAILSLAMALESGQCKRPFIVVPNQTYKNWMSELRGVVENGKIVLTGLLPQYQVNDLYNLGEDYIDQLRDEKGNIKPVGENTITLLTYEGFNRLGFDNDTWNIVGSELLEILNQGVEDEREGEQLAQRIEELMGKGIRGGRVNIEDLGFDYIVVDEAHAMKKSFTMVKGDMKGEDESKKSKSAADKKGEKERERSPYKINSGEPSMTALRGFMISQYILRNNNMRNVQLLTATPFTNSPLEIYSMLALIGYQQLEKSGIKNIKEFFDTFIKASLELVIGPSLKPERKEIVLGFHNLIPLQKLIFKFIIYKSGEDAKIQRPHKIVLPVLNENKNGKIIPLPPEKQVSTNLSMTREQRDFMKDVEAYVLGTKKLSHFCINAASHVDGEQSGGIALDQNKLSDDESRSVRLLRGLSFARQLALSPYLYACNPKSNPTFKQYIETSPKLSYVMECIRSVKHFHEERREEVSGQVIYMNAGVVYFPLIKEYLVREIGFDEKEIGIIKSGMPPAKKEGIKERFLAGGVKVIIGSASIKEGINLQNRASVLYNCWLDWNPTDVKQLEGRIWRFGNMWANVRIVNPLVEDSIDGFIFQKLEEKTSRINEIWYRSGKTNALNLEEFDPSELKLGLVTDPRALAEFMVIEERERIEDEINGLWNQKSVLSNLVEQRKIFNDNIDKVKKIVERYRPVEEGKSRNTDTILRIFGEYLDESKGDYGDEMLYDKVRRANYAIKRGISEVLEPRGLDINFDDKKQTEKFRKEIDDLRKIQDEKTGSDAIVVKTQQIIDDRIKKGYKPKTIAERVREFASLNEKCLTELMVYDNSEEAKVTRLKQDQRGADLERASDNVEELEKILADMKRLEAILQEMDALKAA